MINISQSLLIALFITSMPHQLQPASLLRKESFSKRMSLALMGDDQTAAQELEKFIQTAEDSYELTELLEDYKKIYQEDPLVAAASRGFPVTVLRLLTFSEQHSINEAAEIATVFTRLGSNNMIVPEKTNITGNNYWATRYLLTCEKLQHKELFSLINLMLETHDEAACKTLTLILKKQQEPSLIKATLSMNRGTLIKKMQEKEYLHCLCQLSRIMTAEEQAQAFSQQENKKLLVMINGTLESEADRIQNVHQQRNLENIALPPQEVTQQTPSSDDLSASLSPIDCDHEESDDIIDLFIKPEIFG